MGHSEELRRRIARLAAGSPGPLPVEGVTVFSSGRVTEPLGTVTEPMLALVAQGAKRTALGDRIFDYHAGQYLVVTVDLPLTSQITRATPAEPFLAFGLPLQPALIAQLLADAGPAPARTTDLASRPATPMTTCSTPLSGCCACSTHPVTSRCWRPLCGAKFTGGC